MKTNADTLDFCLSRKLLSQAETAMVAVLLSYIKIKAKEIPVVKMMKVNLFTEKKPWIILYANSWSFASVFHHLLSEVFQCVEKALISILHCHWLTSKGYAIPTVNTNRLFYLEILIFVIICSIMKDYSFIKSELSLFSS